MDPRAILEQLCRRHGLPLDIGLRLAPWLERRLHTSPRRRATILRLVETAVAREASTVGKAQRAQEDYEERCLRAVAGVLHNW